MMAFPETVQKSATKLAQTGFVRIDRLGYPTTAINVKLMHGKYGGVQYAY